jgi:hypothetical protein
MFTILFLIGLWLVAGFYAARGTYFTFIEFASVDGPVWGLTTFVFLTGPFGLAVAALSDWDALKRGFKNEKSPNPVKENYVKFFGLESKFDKDIREWDRLRRWLLIPEWDKIEVIPRSRLYTF